MAAQTLHIPVLLQEVMEFLRPEPGRRFVDGTAGGGGHARALAHSVAPDGRVVAVDLDPAAVARIASDVGGLPIEVYCGSYAHIPELLETIGLPTVDGILLDLGLSSDQLADEERGFSFHSSGALDLRFDPGRGEPAWQLLARLPEGELADLIFRYGEERFSRRIARRIVEVRGKTPIRTASQLADLVRSCVPRARGHHIDPATRTFQGLRIAVNRELESLEQALKVLPGSLRPGGRLAVISFHSLEDRIVKYSFRGDPRLRVVTRRPVSPSDAECAQNSRARSAKLRVAERVGELPAAG